MSRPIVRLLSAASLLLIFTAGVYSDPLAVKVPPEGEDKPDPAHVEQLIAQLGSDDFFDRESASEELVGIGEPVLETMRRVADTSEDLEVQHRADVLVGRIEVKLGMTRGPASCDELIGHLTDSKYPHYREWAATQLGFVTDASRPLAVEALLKASREDGASNVRVACIRSLGRMNTVTEEVTETLKKLSTDSDSRVKEEAKKVLKAQAEQLPPPSEVGANGIGVGQGAAKPRR
jgi:HEAT repeat protein